MFATENDMVIMANSVQLKIWQEATISSFRQNNGYFPLITYFSFTNTSVSKLQNRLNWAGPCGENCRDSHFSDDCVGIDWGKQVIEIN